MSGPAKAGLSIYAKDVKRLAGFYESVLGLAQAHIAPELIVLRSPDIQITVNAMPPEVASLVTITSPPLRRETAALKFFFTVPSLIEAQERAIPLGGEFLPQKWRGPGFIVQNVVDPEGNIFHVRESSV